MSEQYRCSECGHFVEILDDAICDVCNIGKMQHLRYIRGGAGSHWEGCVDVHWDCKIAQLEDELARRNEERNALADDNRMLSERIQRLVEGVKSRDEIIARLKEDAERLAKMHIIKYFDDAFECDICGHGYSKSPELIVHQPDCPITLHRSLMKEIER